MNTRDTSEVASDGSSVSGGFSTAPAQPACGNCGRAQCPTCGSAPRKAGSLISSGGFVYALGRIEARFPNESIEKELAQAIGRAETAGLSDRETMQRVLSAGENIYIARQLCWVLTIENRATYVLAPRDSADVTLLIGSLRPTPRRTDVDVVIGSIVGMAPAVLCNGLQLPMISFAQLYSFDVDSFIESISRPNDAEAKQFASAVEDLLARITQLTDNTGSSDEDRAINYLALRYPAVYQKVAEMTLQDHSWTVDARASRLSASRTLVDVRFSFRSRKTDVVERYFARVDVTELFPFLATKLSPYIYEN